MCTRFGQAHDSVGGSCACPNYPTLLSEGGGSHLKRESHPSPIRLVFWGDWAFPREVHQSAVLRLLRHNRRPYGRCSRVGVS
jgi:hypothetical protein